MQQIKNSNANALYTKSVKFFEWKMIVQYLCVYIAVGKFEWIICATRWPSNQFSQQEFVCFVLNRKTVSILTMTSISAEQSITVSHHEKQMNRTWNGTKLGTFDQLDIYERMWIKKSSVYTTAATLIAIVFCFSFRRFFICKCSEAS